MRNALPQEFVALPRDSARGLIDPNRLWDGRWLWREPPSGTEPSQPPAFITRRTSHETPCFAAEYLPGAGRLPGARRRRARAPVPAWGQAAGMGGIGSSQRITARAKVQAIDLANREATLVGPQGNVFTVHVSDAVHNLDQVKAGDTVVVTYCPPRSCWCCRRREPRISADEANAAFARAPKGHVPAAALGTRVIVTGTVVGVDIPDNTISLVDPLGGQVHTFNVTDPRRQAALKRVKVGDTLTAIGTEALAIGLQPA